MKGPAGVVFSPAIKSAGILAEDAAEMLRGIIPDETSVELEKPDPNVGHHAIVTKADDGIQSFILQTLVENFPGARFIAEEKAGGIAQVISRDEDLGVLQDGGFVFGIDPLDGTSMFQNQLWESSVSIGVMENGMHVGGGISAPYVRGGISVVGERGKGVFLSEGPTGGWSRVSNIQDRPLKQAVVFIGPDIFFMDQFNRFVNEFSRRVRTTSCIGSGALGLAMVAAGRVDALIQPVQCPWDWFAGYPLVEEAGGKVQFYHYREGKIEALPKPDLPSYSPTGRNTAFIAGSPAIVDFLFDSLAKPFGK